MGEDFPTCRLSCRSGDPDRHAEVLPWSVKPVQRAESENSVIAGALGAEKHCARLWEKEEMENKPTPRL